MAEQSNKVNGAETIFGSKSIKRSSELDAALLYQILDDSINAVYICDYETDKLLYVNKKAEEFAKINHTNILPDMTCYQIIMQTNMPCSFCMKPRLKEASFIEEIVESAISDNTFRVKAKIINWNNRKAALYFLIDETTVAINNRALHNNYKELKKAQIRLEESQKTMRAAIEALNVFYFEYFPDKDYALEYNGRLEFGISACMTNYPQSWFDKKITHPDDELFLKDVFRDIKNGAKQKSCVVRNLFQGKYIWYSYTFTSIYDEDGQRLKVVCTAQDISNEKYVQEMSLNLMHNLPGAAVRFDVDSDGPHLAYISEGCQKVTGYSADEIIKMCSDDLLALVHDEDKAKVIAKIKENAELRKTKNNNSEAYIFRCRCKNGNYRWTTLNLSMIDNNGIIQYYGVSIDVNAEQEAGIMLNQLVNYIPGGVAIYKLSCKSLETLYLSDGMEKLTGYTNEEYKKMMHSNPLAYVYEDDKLRFKRIVKEALMTEKPMAISFRMNKKDGTFLWVQLSATKIREVDGEQIYYVIYTKPPKEASLYQSIVDDSESAIFIAEKSSRKLILANRSWKRLRFLDEEKTVIGHSLYTTIPIEDVLFSDEEVAALPENCYVEKHSISSYNQHLHIKARSLQWNEQQAYICYIHDETELWKSHQEMAQLLNNVPAGIGTYEIVDGKASLKFINDGYYRVIGDDSAKRNCYVGENHLNAVYYEDRELMQDTVKKFTAGEEWVTTVYRVNVANDQIVWVRFVGTVIERSAKRIIVYASFSNVSMIMRVQQELESNKTMLNLALKSAKVSTWKLDIAKRQIIFPDKADWLNGLPTKIENVPESLTKLCSLPPDTVESYKILYEKAYRGEYAEAEARILIPGTNECSWQRVIYTPVYDLNGRIISSIGMSMDITEQKKREHNYEEQLRMKRILDKEMLLVVLYNLTTNKIIEKETPIPELMTIMDSAESADDALTSVCELADVGDGFDSLRAVSDHKALLTAYSRGKTHFKIRHHMKNYNGWLETSFDIIANPYTDDVEAIVVSRDVTAVVRSEMIVDMLIKTNYDSIFTFDAEIGTPIPFSNNKQHNGSIEDLPEESSNSAAVYFRSYCANDNIEQIITENSLPIIRKELEASNVYITLYSIRLHDKIYHKRAMYAYLDSTQQTILCAIQDVSDAYEKEERQKQALTDALLKAERANSAKTEFFSRMSHDMRTPMNGILGLAELSRDETELSVLKNNMQKINESGYYLLSLINDTLDFQRIESGKLHLEPQIVKCGVLLTSIVDMIMVSAREKGVEFVFDNKNVDLNQYICIDPVRIKQIIINLLSNAVKFTPTGGMVSFEIQSLKNEGMVSHDLIGIRDNGIGMSADFIQNGIFKPFSQEYSAVSTQYAGSGLGLSIVHSLVEMMGGTIHVESELGVGTTFIIELDFEHVDKKEVIEDNKNGQNHRCLIEQTLKNKHILLVEDHPLNAEIGKKLLAKIGCMTVWCKNGQQAVNEFEKSSNNYYDAILMDIRMPVMNGIDAAKKIRNLDRSDAKTVPIIAMTANAYEEDVKCSIAAGMNSHLAKPVEPMKLYDTLVKMITAAAKL